MTESRKQFEDFLEKRNAALKAEGASSRFMITNAHWATWQASRAAIVVKLPNSFHDKYDQYVYDGSELELSLDEAGVKYE